MTPSVRVFEVCVLLALCAGCVAEEATKDPGDEGPDTAEPPGPPDGGPRLVVPGGLAPALMFGWTTSRGGSSP